MIDSHCHLAGEEFAADLEEVIARATAAGISGALVIVGAEDDDEYKRAAAVTRTWPGARLSIGVHPHTAGKFAADPAAAATLVEARLAGRPAARAIGEIGLDYHYDFSPRGVQQDVFRAQLQLARERDLPVVIHTREATDDTFRVIEEAGRVRGVFHCFTGDESMARRAAAVDFYVSFAGILTFPRAEDIRAAAGIVPLDRLLVETDSPYLAPVPYRGKRNEPAFVGEVVGRLAALRAISPSELGAQVTRNFDTLFAALH